MNFSAVAGGQTCVGYETHSSNSAALGRGRDVQSDGICCLQSVLLSCSCLVLGCVPIARKGERSPIYTAMHNTLYCIVRRKSSKLPLSPSSHAPHTYHDLTLMYHKVHSLTIFMANPFSFSQAVFKQLQEARIRLVAKK